MNIKKIFGEKIKRIRKSKKLTQEQLSEMVDIDARNLSKIELGQCFVKAETLDKLVVALNITPEELFAVDHIKEPEVLISDMIRILNSMKDCPRKLEKIYRFLRIIESED